MHEVKMRKADIAVILGIHPSTLSNYLRDGILSELENKNTEFDIKKWISESVVIVKEKKEATKQAMNERPWIKRTTIKFKKNQMKLTIIDSENLNELVEYMRDVCEKFYNTTDSYGGPAGITCEEVRRVYGDLEGKGLI